jgi:hypothetical protein
VSALLILRRIGRCNGTKKEDLKMDLGRLHQILKEAGYLVGKPNDETDPRVEKIDCEFIYVAVRKDEARQHRDELLAMVKELRSLEEAGSYIEVGFEIGGQEEAILLFGVGHFLEFWQVTTPSSLGGSPNPEAAKKGFLMLAGLQFNFP